MIYSASGLFETLGSGGGSVVEGRLLSERHQNIRGKHEQRVVYGKRGVVRQSSPCVGRYVTSRRR